MKCRVQSLGWRRPAAEGTSRLVAKTRVLNTILNDVIPDPRDAILIGLMHTCDGFKLILSDEDYRESLERIETLSKLDLVGRAVSAAVRESAFKPKTRRILRTKRIPRLRIVDILRQSDFRRGNIAKGLCHIFEKYGSVVEVPIRMDGQRAIALIGAEANHWINKHGRFYLRSKDYLEGAFGASRTLPGMDGPEHHKMRKSLRGAYSRAALAQRLPELIHHCKDGIGPWKEGDVFGATETFQTYISSQVSHLTIGVDCRPYVDELLAYEHRALVTLVQRAMPKFMLSTPRMMRARNSSWHFRTRSTRRTHRRRGKESHRTSPTRYSSCIGTIRSSCRKRTWFSHLSHPWSPASISAVRLASPSTPWLATRICTRQSVGRRTRCSEMGTNRRRGTSTAEAWMSRTGCFSSPNACTP